MKRDVIKFFFLAPPLAVARVGSGRTPLDNFSIHRNGKSATTPKAVEIRPELTLDIEEDGMLHAFTPRVIRFKAPNKDGKPAFRPVCPWFELWCETEDADGVRNRRPVLPADFPSDHPGVSWDIELGNRKAYAVTQSRGDIIRSTCVTIAAGNTEAHEISGWSQDATEDEPPLVHEEQPLSFGSLRAARPHEQFGFRARFTPPTGNVFGPADLVERLAEHERGKVALHPAPAWRHLSLLRDNRQAGFLILNPQAHWCGGGPHSPTDEPQRVATGLLRSVPADGTAAPVNDQNVPLGLMDDLSDGVIGCSFTHGGTAYHVRARVLVAPPDFTPDYRPALTLTDLLHDRVYQRDREALERIYNGADGGETAHSVPTSEITGEIHALFQNFNADGAHSIQDLSPRDLKALVNAPPNEVTGQPAHGNSHAKFPVTTHVRNAAPSHLTRWQYDLLNLWIARLEEASAASSSAAGETGYES